MNILFIGNSYVYASLRFLTPIFNKFPSYKFDNLDIDFLYVASGSVDVFANNFNSSLSNKLSGSFSVAKIPNVLYHYKYGEKRLLEERMPDTSISNVVKSKRYDIIVLGICSSMHKNALILDECYTYYESFVNDIRKISGAKLYLFETACLRDLPGDRMYKQFNDWFYTGKFAVCKNRTEMYEHLNKLEDVICKKLNLDVIPIRNAFRHFRKYFDNEFKLFVDVHHPDIGIGRYVYFAILYYSIFYAILDIDLKDIPFTYKCKDTDTQYAENKRCIDITPHNKALADNVIKKIYNFMIKTEFPIDIVLPYVNCNDPNWQKDFRNRNLRMGTDFHNNKTRYRDCGTLYYCIKSILKFLPWINKIHLIVSHESQVPPWCRKYVNVILHEDFIPKELCPCFNSSSIESFLGNLPVAEHFIYINDDMIFTNPIKRTDYFTKQGNPRTSVYLSDDSKNSVSANLRNRVFKFVTGINNDSRYFWNEHGPEPYRLSWCKEFLNNNYSAFYESGKLLMRDPEKMLTQWVYCFYQFFWKNTHPNKLIGKSFSSPLKLSNFDSKKLKNLHWICVNDSDDVTEIETKNILHKKLMHIIN